MASQKPKDKKKDDKKVMQELTQRQEEEKQFVEKEIVLNYLKSKLGRYQEQGEKLQVINFKLSDELEVQKLNLKDINEFLTNELKARSLTSAALEEKVFELQQQLEEQKKQFEAELAKVEVDRRKEAEVVSSKLVEYDKKVKQTQEFLDKKDAMEAELSTLKKALEAQAKDTEQRLADLDRQHIQDREKWRKETAQRIKDTKLQMLKLTDDQLEATTKRTIVENELMSSELAYQSKQTEKLIDMNAMLMDQVADLKRQLQVEKSTQEGMARRNKAYKKTTRALLLKLRSVQPNLEFEDSGGDESPSELTPRPGTVAEDAIPRLLEELQEKKRELEEWQVVVRQGANGLINFLGTSLSSLYGECVAPTPAATCLLPEDEDPILEALRDQSLATLSVDQRKSILDYLLQKTQEYVNVLYGTKEARRPSFVRTDPRESTENSDVGSQLLSPTGPHVVPCLPGVDDTGMPSTALDPPNSLPSTDIEVQDHPTCATNPISVRGAGAAPGQTQVEPQKVVEASKGCSRGTRDPAPRDLKSGAVPHRKQLDDPTGSLFPPISSGRSPVARSSSSFSISDPESRLWPQANDGSCSPSSGQGSRDTLASHATPQYVSVGVQTAAQGTGCVDTIRCKLMSDVRPWGRSIEAEVPGLQVAGRLHRGKTSRSASPVKRSYG